MERIKAFIEKWGYVVFLALVGVALMFAVGCSIYTAVTNPWVAIIALVGAIMALATIVWTIYKEVKR